jgi:hypothetical protein
MTTSPEGGGSPGPEDTAGTIGDDQLPEDLRPTDDNPLAKNPDEEEEESGGPEAEPPVAPPAPDA